MKLTSALAAVTALSLSSIANANCLNYREANTLANDFGRLISDYSNQLANQILTPNYVDYSESVNTLIDNGGTTPQALLGPTFSSRAGFESASAQQPAVPFTVKNLWFTCDVMTIRWESDQSPQPVVGISVAHVVPAPRSGSPVGWQIDEVWAEFDSGAWLVDLGIFKPAASKEKRAIAFKA